MHSKSSLGESGTPAVCAGMAAPAEAPEFKQLAADPEVSVGSISDLICIPVPFLID